MHFPGTSSASPNTSSSAEYILKPASVNSNNDTLLGEIPFCRVKNIKVDMRESEDGYGLTGIEYTSDTEEYDVYGIPFVKLTGMETNIYISQ